MFDTVYFYLMVVVIVFALGDLISYFTKGRLSGLMMVMLLFLIGFLTGILPKDIINRAGLTQLASASTGMLLFNMGSTINIRQLINEWRTVTLAALCLIGSCIAMLCVSPIIGLNTVLIGMPSINGAAVATSMMSEAAAANGFTTAAAMCAVIFATQRFVGAPLASTMGRRYAKVLLEEYRSNPSVHADAPASGTLTETAKILFYEKHKSFFTSNVLIGIACAGAFIARLLGSVTPVDYSIWALILGLVTGIGGYIPPKPLQRGNAYGLIMIAVFGSIIPALGGVTLDDLGTLALQLIVMFGSACIGIVLVAVVLPGWKLVGNRNLAVGIGAMQFLGFPSNVVVVREVSEVMGETEEEKNYINEKLSVSYVVGGITVVTILSVVMASIISSILF